MDHKHARAVTTVSSEMGKILTRYCIAYGVLQKNPNPDAVSINEGISNYVLSFYEEMERQVSELEKAVGISYGSRSVLKEELDHGQAV